MFIKREARGKRACFSRPETAHRRPGLGWKIDRIEARGKIRFANIRPHEARGLSGRKRDAEPGRAPVYRLFEAVAVAYAQQNAGPARGRADHVARVQADALPQGAARARMR